MKETIEEAAEREYIFEEDPAFPDDREHKDFIRIFEKGAKWMRERMYSEEEVKNIISNLVRDCYYMQEPNQDVAEWFEQFKKKL